MPLDPREVTGMRGEAQSTTNEPAKNVRQEVGRFDKLTTRHGIESGRPLGVWRGWLRQNTIP